MDNLTSTLIQQINAIASTIEMLEYTHVKKVNMEDESLSLSQLETEYDKRFEKQQRIYEYLKAYSELSKLLEEFQQRIRDYLHRCENEKENNGNEMNEMLDKMKELEQTKIKKMKNKTEYKTVNYKHQMVPTEVYKKKVEELRMRKEKEKEEKEKLKRERRERERQEEIERQKNHRKQTIKAFKERRLGEIKVIVIGDQTAKKGELLVTYTTNCFPDTYVPTVFDNYSAPISVDGRTIQMNLWDTSGSDDLDEMRPLSYSYTDCFMVMFSIADEDSFERVKTKWVPEIRANCGYDNPSIVLVGTESHLRNNQNAIDTLKSQGKELVSRKHIQAMGEEVGAEFSVECSAVTQSGLKELFELVAKTAVGYFLPEDTPKQKGKKKGFREKLFGKK